MCPRREHFNLCHADLRYAVATPNPIQLGKLERERDVSKGVRSEVTERIKGKKKERKKTKKQWLTEGEKKENKIYASCYSTIM